MTISREVLHHHIGYMVWASARLLSAAAELSPEELTRDFRTSEKSILGTLVHLFAADRLWLRRLRTPPPHPPFVEERDRSLTVLSTEWPYLHREWQEWATLLMTDQMESPLTYFDLKGKEWTNPVWQIVLHVVNHGTHHRGQVSGFLRALGRTPPPLDLIAYYRQLE